jgi:adenosine deaminase
MAATKGYTELHRHIDVSVRLSTLLELAQERGLVPTSTSLDAFREDFVLREPMKDLGSVLAKFTLYQQVLDRPDVIARAAFEACEDAYREGIRKCEFRFSPGFVTGLSKLAWIDALDGFSTGLERAMREYRDFRAGLICIGSRDFGMDSIEKTVEFFLKYDDRFIGFDLAGDEAQFPNTLYEKVMDPVVMSGANITIHAGEAAGPDSVWAAIERLGAKRIGHGIRSIEDPKLLETLRERDILLEMCPTSNRITSAWSDPATHPFKRCFEAGVPVSLNTDDPSIFGNTLPDEIRIARTMMGMSEAQIDRSFDIAARHSFLPNRNEVPMEIRRLSATLLLAASLTGCLKPGKAEVPRQPQIEPLANTIQLVDVRASENAIEVALARTDVAEPVRRAGDLKPNEFGERLRYVKDPFGKLTYVATESTNYLGYYVPSCYDSACTAIDLTLNRDGAGKDLNQQAILHVERIPSLSCLLSTTQSGATVKSELSFTNATFSKVVGNPRVALYAHKDPSFDPATDGIRESFLRTSLTSRASFRLDDLISKVGEIPKAVTSQGTVTKTTWDAATRTFDVDANRTDGAKLALRCKY